VTKKNHLQNKFETKKQVRRHELKTSRQKTQTKYKQQDTIKKQVGTRQNKARQAQKDSKEKTNSKNKRQACTHKQKTSIIL
jgi:hypothetical protein